MQEHRVLITEEIDEAGKELLCRHGCRIRMGSGIGEDSVRRDAHDCEAILTRNARITENVISSCPELKVISMHGVGTDLIDVDCATSFGIQVTNAARSNQNTVAEYTIGLILALSRNIVRYCEGTKEGDWGIRSLCGSDLEGKTLGIIGMGRIGSLVARKAAYGFGMKVIGYRRHPENTAEMDYAVLTDDINEVIRKSDFVSLHVPYTPTTKKLFGAAEFSLMKPGACLVNTARGEVVDETALVLALREKRIAGAAVDVYVGGIPSMDNPLFHMENVIATPHTAAFTREALQRMSYQAALGIVETLEGRRPTYPVNNPNPFFDGMLKRG